MSRDSAFLKAASLLSSALFIAAPLIGLAPVATSKHVSEVDVSPSTVTQLKLSALAALNNFFKTPTGKAASVKTKASMVAISGAIMPEPLAMPVRVIV